MSKQDKINKRKYSLDNPLNQRNILFPTTDNWCPTLPNNKVRGGLFILSDGQWRVCFWGNDDLGMERDFPTYDEALAIWEEIKKWDNVRVSYLKTLGFVGA